MGEVYLAEDLKLRRKVALKLLPSGVAEDTQRLKRFEREAQAIAALNHPNIAQLYSIEEDAGEHFLVMEWVTGKTLRDSLPKGGFGLDRFFEIALALADAIGVAHERDIVHRDLKPENIMTTRSGDVKVLDLGLAKLVEGLATNDLSEHPTASVTADGRIVGTVPYLSPEQGEGGTVDQRSDIFSMGIILYEMASGEHSSPATRRLWCSLRSSGSLRHQCARSSARYPGTSSASSIGASRKVSSVAATAPWIFDTV